MNALEANLLDRATGRLSDSILRRRMMEAEQEERQVDRAMRGGEFELARQDRAADREMRREEMGERREERQQTQANLDTYRKQMLEAKTDEDKFRVWNDLLKSGMATQQTLDNMAKGMSEKLGVEVTLKMPAAKPGFNTRAGHELELAEKYRERANAARRNGAGDEAERYQRIAEQLERGVGREEESTATVTEDIREPGASPYDEPRARVTRKVPLSEVERMIQGIQPKEAATVTNAAPAGATSAAPKVGEVLNGYRYNGKFPPSDRRAWDKL